MAGMQFQVARLDSTLYEAADGWKSIHAFIEHLLSSSADRSGLVLVVGELPGAAEEVNRIFESIVTSGNQNWESEVNVLEERHTAAAKASGLSSLPSAAKSSFDALRKLLLGVSLVREGSHRVRAQIMALVSDAAAAVTAGFFSSVGLESISQLDSRSALRTVRDEGASLAPSTEEAARLQYLDAICDQPFVDEKLISSLNASALSAKHSFWIVQGGVGSDLSNDSTTLLSGGTDASAAYWASLLGASSVRFVTHKPGFFTQSPPPSNAHLLLQLEYNEAQEIAASGAVDLHPIAIKVLQEREISLQVTSSSFLSSSKPMSKITTTISNVKSSSTQVAKSICLRSGILLITIDALAMWRRVGFLADVFAVFKRQGISIDFVTTSESNITVTVDQSSNSNMALIESALRELRSQLHCQAALVPDCAAISVVGQNIKTALAELGPAFSIFSGSRLYLVSQSASDVNVTFLVHEEEASSLATKLHDQLFGSKAKEESQQQLFGATLTELTKPGGLNVSLQEESAEVDHASEKTTSSSSSFSRSISVADDVDDPRSRWWFDKRDILVELAEQQTPLYVYDASTLQLRAAELFEYLHRSGGGVLDNLFYAIKANENPDVLRTLFEAGLNFECVSMPEVHLILSLFPQIPRNRILFTPNFARKEEYAEALELGVWLTLDNLHPLLSWGSLFSGREVFVRLDPGKGMGHHKHVHTGGDDSKFGITPDEIDTLNAAADKHNLRIVGLHAHLGSGILESDAWAGTAAFFDSVLSKLTNVRILDLGGGLGVPYRREQKRLDLGAVADLLRPFRQRFPTLQLWMEPGRYLVCESGVLLGKCTQTKRKHNHVYVGLDAGMNSLIRPALYESYHEIVNLTRVHETPCETVDVVGPICESGDILGLQRLMPAAQEGDIFAVCNAGAYGRAMGSFYNMRHPGLEVLLRNDESVTSALEKLQQARESLSAHSFL